MNKEKLLKEVARQKGTKTNLKAHKVALNLVSEAEQKAEKIEEISSEASYYADSRFEELLDKYYDLNNEISIEVDNYVINSEVGYLEEACLELDAQLQTIESAAEELGIPPENIMNNYEQVHDTYTEGMRTVIAFRDSYSDFVREINKQFIADFTGKFS